MIINKLNNVRNFEPIIFVWLEFVEVRRFSNFSLFPQEPQTNATHSPNTFIQTENTFVSDSRLNTSFVIHSTIYINKCKICANIIWKKQQNKQNHISYTYKYQYRLAYTKLPVF